MSVPAIIFSCCYFLLLAGSTLVYFFLFVRLLEDTSKSYGSVFRKFGE